MLGSCQTCILLNDFKADMMDRLMLNSPRVGEISFQILLRAFVEACKKSHLQYIRSKNPAVFCDHGGFKRMKLARVLLGFSLYNLNQLEMTKPLKVQHLIHISSTSHPGFPQPVHHHGHWPRLNPENTHLDLLRSLIGNGGIDFLLF